jgi:hypothetical protein
VSWDRKKPWTAPAHNVTLYRSAGQWKFGLWSDAGIIDGTVVGISADDEPAVAQATFLKTLAEATGVAYTAQWTEKSRGTWYGGLTAP